MVSVYVVVGLGVWIVPSFKLKWKWNNAKKTYTHTEKLEAFQLFTLRINRRIFNSNVFPPLWSSQQRNRGLVEYDSWVVSWSPHKLLLQFGALNGWWRTQHPSLLWRHSESMGNQSSMLSVYPSSKGKKLGSRTVFKHVHAIFSPCYLGEP